MKPELGYYLAPGPIGNVGIPIYGLRAVPREIAERQWGDASFAQKNWQVEIFAFGHYVWINQERALIFLH